MPDDDPPAWKVGVLFSRSGVTGLTETEHVLGTALAVEEINTAGGVRGRPIAPLCLDPAGDPVAYRALARRMLADEGVGVIFGCSLSASRKAVLPLLERHDGLLWYPSIYEGFEYSESVLYTGATLNQTVFPLADYLLHRHGPRILIVGSDYIYPRESNRVMRDIVESRGGTVVGERYLPLDVDDGAIRPLMDEIVRLEPDAVFSTMVGQGARRLYRLYAEAGIDRARRPIASLTLAEGEIAAIGPHLCDGHLLAATYFGALDSPANRRFDRSFRERFGDGPPPSMWSQTAYAQVHLFARALAEAGSLDARRLGEAALRTRFAAPEGDLAFDAENRHLWLTPGIGVARPDGQFDILWRADAPVRPDPWLASTRFEASWARASDVVPVVP
ncbi:transporter substrate-binding domain-containing protein [Lichenibacterium ramalinae]|uniref:Amino acid ABC transporter substrate-binding protein n=1 Tax=Lichenibacterium ramalinae TaxID=2316527 RepID=A0A4Q2RCJ3_9HYPH|nr:transporter substrate-binding domain-containing protein [Lichenibacterium ramalinae]RYB05231.1 amino acid ABC transporter substrate-binding protein [Lichenibacterium ramalinae]